MRRSDAFLASTPTRSAWSQRTRVVALALPVALVLLAAGSAAAAPPLTVTPTAVTFPDTPVATASAQKLVTLTNTGAAGVLITSIVVDGASGADFLLDTSQLPPPVTIGTGADAAFGVTFKPSSPGLRNASVVVTLGGGLGTLTVPLSGTGLGPKIAVAPNPIAAGGVVLGGAISTDVKVANSGGGVLNVRGFVVSGPGASAFTVTNVPALPAPVQPQSSITVQLQFNPTAPGAYSATLTVDSDDPKTPSVQVPLTASAGSPVCSLGTTGIFFGNARVGTTSGVTPVLVSNTGFSDLHVASVTVDGMNPGDYVVDSTGLPSTLAAGAQGTIKVQFKPAALGASAARLVINSDDPNAASQSLRLTGTGTFTTLALAQSSLDFGKQRVFTAAPSQSIVITNTGGTDAANVIAAQAMGPQASWFRLGPGQTFPLRIPMGGSVKIDVTALPVGLGSGSADFVLMTDDPKTPSLSVAVSAIGMGGTLTVDPPNADFGAVGVLGTATKTITLGNSGTDVLTIGSLALGGSDPDAFIIAGQPMIPATLKPGESLQIDVAFKPAVVSTYSAEIDLVTDDPVARSLKIPLDGQGADGSVEASPMTLNFNTQLVGQQAAAQAVTLTNRGATSIPITGLSLSGVNPNQFRFDDPGSFTLGAGQSRVVQVAYAPLSAGAHSAQLVIAPQGFVPVQVRLSGVGVSPVLQVARGSTMLDFGNVTLGTTSEPALVGLKNGGTTPFAIESIRASDPSFVLDTSKLSTSPIAAGGTTEFLVSFLPSVVGMKSGKIQITLAGGSQPAATIDVTGMGVPAPKPAATGCGVGARPGAVSSPLPLGLAVVLAAVAIGGHRRRRDRSQTSRARG